MDLLKNIENHKSKFIEVISKPVFTIGKTESEPAVWMGKVLSLLRDLKIKGNSIFLIGNGASSSMSSHFAVDLTKNAGIRSFSNNDGALLTCFGNDFSLKHPISKWQNVICATAISCWRSAVRGNL